MSPDMFRNNIQNYKIFFLYFKFIILKNKFLYDKENFDTFMEIAFKWIRVLLNGMMNSKTEYLS